MKRVKVRHNLTGERFGRLLVLEQTDDWISPTSGDHKAQWLCQCDCGNKCKVTTGDLVTKNNQSCNCLHYETIVKRHKYNKYDVSGEYGIGYLEDGSEFYFDLEDYDLIKDYRWTCEYGYIICYKTENMKRFRIQFHRLVMGLSKEDERIIDHKNLKRNDNRKENLRICTYSQNTFNRNRKAKTNKSGHVGVNIVHTKTKGDRYRVLITANGVRHNLGYYDNLQDAINARIKGEIKYHGEFRYQGN